MASTPGRGPASEPVHRRLGEQAAALRLHVAEAREGTPDAVHRTRVACRRLRGALATFRPLLDREVTDPVRDELGRLARALGEARDAEVVHARLVALVEAEPEHLRAGPARTRLDRALAPRRRAGDAAAQAVLSGAGLDRLLGAVDALVADPPWTARASEPAAELLPTLVDHDRTRLRRRVRTVVDLRRAGDQVDAAALEDAVHAVRKDAKRLRYAVEALGPAWGPDARRLRKRAQALATALGDRQDAVLARACLEELAASTGAVGRSGFTWGRLHAAEGARVLAAEERLVPLWERVPRMR